MSKAVLVLGDTGSGKSRSIKGLNPKKTFLINISGKDLPFREAERNYTLCNTENPTGNLVITESVKKVAKTLNYINEERLDIKNVVIDDNQYLSLFTFVNRIGERDGFAKFNDIAVHLVELVQLAKSLRPNLTVYFLHHIEAGYDAQSNERLGAMTMGKFVKEKVKYEGLFSIVIMADKEGDERGEPTYFFWTRMAKSTVKTPEGMFDKQKIPNDLGIVAKAIYEYYN